METLFLVGLQDIIVHQDIPLLNTEITMAWTINAVVWVNTPGHDTIGRHMSSTANPDICNSEMHQYMYCT